jgi:hypothetical protein
MTTLRCLLYCSIFYFSLIVCRAAPTAQPPLGTWLIWSPSKEWSHLMKGLGIRRPSQGSQMKSLKILRIQRLSLQSQFGHRHHALMFGMMSLQSTEIFRIRLRLSNALADLRSSKWVFSFRIFASSVLIHIWTIRRSSQIIRSCI